MAMFIAWMCFFMIHQKQLLERKHGSIWGHIKKDNVSN